MAKRGRKRAVTPETWTPAQLRKIDSMARDQCKDTTIAEVLGVEVETFRTEFSERTRQKRAEGKRDLYFWQRLRAKSGSDTMLIWMGKQHLEQSDRHEVEHTGTVEHRVVMFGQNPGGSDGGSGATPAGV